MSKEESLEGKAKELEEKEKDLADRSRQFDLRMAEQQERFWKDKRAFEVRHSELTRELEAKNRALVEAQDELAKLEKDVRSKEAKQTSRLDEK